MDTSFQFQDSLLPSFKDYLVIVCCQISIMNNDIVSGNEKRKKKSTMSWPSCTVLTPIEFTPIFCSSSKSGDWWHHTGAFLQVSLALGFFSGTESHVFNSDHKHMAGNELQAIHHWAHKESFNDRQQIGCCDHWSVWYIQPLIGVEPCSCIDDNQHVHTQTPENLTGKVTFPIGNLTFPVGYPSCLLNVPYIAI